MTHDTGIAISRFLEADLLGRQLSDLFVFSRSLNARGKLGSLHLATGLLRALAASELIRTARDHDLGVPPDALEVYLRHCTASRIQGFVRCLRGYPRDDVAAVFSAVAARLSAAGRLGAVWARVRDHAQQCVFSDGQPSPSPSSAEPDKSSAPPAVADGDT